jgi:hypothetical protein
MHGVADLLVRLRCRQKPAGLTAGRPDEGVWAYASRRDEGGPTRPMRCACCNQMFRRGDGVNLQLKFEELGEETSNFRRADS